MYCYVYDYIITNDLGKNNLRGVLMLETTKRRHEMIKDDIEATRESYEKIGVKSPVKRTWEKVAERHGLSWVTVRNIDYEY